MRSFTDSLFEAIHRRIERRYPGWNPDAALRYLPVAQALGRSGPAARVLDVGSAGEGLSRYWDGTAFELDLRMPQGPGEAGPSRRRVLGSGLALPFRDGAFDAVVSSDVLEHLAPEDRPSLVGEMLRVGRRQIVLAVPCGQASREAEAEVDRVHRDRHGPSHAWLEEHLRHGLPDEEDVLHAIRSRALALGKEASIRVEGNTNLALWRWLFRRYFGAGPRGARLMRDGLLALLPLLRHAHWGRTYRKIFFVQLRARAPEPSSGTAGLTGQDKTAGHGAGPDR
ncbi:MAG: methyltransferase domain-containing protein [bacterium]